MRVRMVMERGNFKMSLDPYSLTSTLELRVFHFLFKNASFFNVHLVSTKPSGKTSYLLISSNKTLEKTDLTI